MLLLLFINGRTFCACFFLFVLLSYGRRCCASLTISNSKSLSNQIRIKCSLSLRSLRSLIFVKSSLHYVQYSMYNNYLRVCLVCLYVCLCARFLCCNCFYWTGRVDTQLLLSVFFSLFFHPFSVLFLSVYNSECALKQKKITLFVCLFTSSLPHSCNYSDQLNKNKS